MKLFLKGIPTFAYGISGLLLARHVEYVNTQKGKIKIYFWYKEDKSSPY